MELKKEKRIVIVILAVLLTMIAGLTVAAMILRNRDTAGTETETNLVEAADPEGTLAVPQYCVNNI